MLKVLFLCHGNICRSPMAELIMEEMARRGGHADKMVINSRAISTEEIGHPIYPKALEKLKEKGIPVLSHTAKVVTPNDVDMYDFIIVMDDNNLSTFNRMYNAQGKVFKLMYFVGNSVDIKDPWYTEDFETAFNDIYRGCEAFYNYLIQNNKIY